MVFFDPANSSILKRDLVYFRRNFIVCPEQWETISGKYEDFEWNEIKFTDVNERLINEVEGLYLFLLSPRKVNAPFINYKLYVGETQNLKQRFRDYLNKRHKPKSSQFKMQELVSDFPENLYFCYVELNGLDEIQRKEIEDDFLVAFMPPTNSKYPKYIQRVVLAAYEH